MLINLYYPPTEPIMENQTKTIIGLGTLCALACPEPARPLLALITLGYLATINTPSEATAAAIHYLIYLASLLKAGIANLTDSEQIDPDVLAWISRIASESKPGDTLKPTSAAAKSMTAGARTRVKVSKEGEAEV